MTLKAYAERNGYILAAVYGRNAWDTHYYYVRTGFPDSADARRPPPHASTTAGTASPRPTSRPPPEGAVLNCPSRRLSDPVVQRPRTRPFQGRNTGSNPVGVAKLGSLLSTVSKLPKSVVTATPSLPHP